jgi:transposase
VSQCTRRQCSSRLWVPTCRFRRLEHLDTSTASTHAGVYRLGWLVAFVDQDRAWRRQIRRLESELDALLDEHGTTLHDEPGIGPIAAAMLICEVGDPTRFNRESKFARWCETGAVALSSGEGSGQPARHRLDFGGNRRIMATPLEAKPMTCPPSAFHTGGGLVRLEPVRR